MIYVYDHGRLYCEASCGLNNQIPHFLDNALIRAYSFIYGNVHEG